MYFPNTKWTALFMGIALVQACIVLAFEAYVFAEFKIDVTKVEGSPTPTATAILTFLALYIFGFIYQLFLVYDALRMKNTIQVIGLVLLNIGLLIYGAVQLDTVQDGFNRLTGAGYVWHQLRPYMIAIPCILGLCTILFAFVAWKLYDEFAWTIYKHISADLRMKRRYLTYQIFIALLKFDFFFFLGFTIQFVVIVHGRTNTEFGLTIAAIPVTIFILIAAAWFTRREILTGMITSIALFFGGLGYFVFKLYRMYEPGFEQEYAVARKELATFAVITILLIVITIVYACMCAANFGKGLRPYVSRVKSDPDQEKLNGNGVSPPPYLGAGGGGVGGASSGNYGGYGGQGLEMVSEPFGKPPRVVPTRMEID